MDKGIVDQVFKQDYPDPRVRPWDVLALIERESGGVPYFGQTEPLYVENLNAAVRTTGLSRTQIEASIEITHGLYEGRLAKFRCEPSYWAWAKTLVGFLPVERFLLSCSFGLGQKMSRWYCLDLDRSIWVDQLKEFIGDTEKQIQTIIQDLCTNIHLANGNKALMFAIYNGGPGVKVGDEVFREYGMPVATRAAQIQILLNQGKYV